MKVLNKGGDRQYTARMQNANAMVEMIKADPPKNLEVIDDVGMEFLIRSQTIHERWYVVNLGTECCECEDRVSICKHLLAVRKLVDVEFTYLKRILFVEEGGFVNNLDDVGEDDVTSPPQNPELNPPPPAMDDTGERDDNLGVIQLKTTEVKVHPQTQVRLEKLNDLYYELGRNYFTTERMKNIGLIHVENAIRRLNDLKKELQIAFNPQLVPRHVSLCLVLVVISLQFKRMYQGPSLGMGGHGIPKTRTQLVQVKTQTPHKHQVLIFLYILLESFEVVIK